MIPFGLTRGLSPAEIPDEVARLDAEIRELEPRLLELKRLRRSLLAALRMRHRWRRWRLERAA